MSGTVKLLGALGTLAVLAACAPTSPPPPPRPQARVFSSDLEGGAKRCEAPTLTALPTDKPTEAKMVLANEGGWCGLPLAQPGPDPYAAGLLTGRPVHGRVTIRSVGDYTRVDYTPDPGYVGPDAFTVKLVPGMATVQVAVTVEPGPPPPPPAVVAPAPVPTPAARPAPNTRTPGARRGN